MIFLNTRPNIPFLWLIILMLAPAAVFAQQDWELPVVVKATKADKKLEGAVVTLLKSGSTVQSITTGSNGKAEFKLAPNGDYLITVTKAGHITKRFSISTFGVPDERGKMGFGIFEFEVGIFVQASCGDYSILNQPIAKVKYDAKNEDFGFDMSYTNSILSKLEPLEDLEQKAKQYEAVINKADKQFASKDYKGAISEYKNASSLLACEKYPGEQIKKAEELLAAGEKEKQKQKQYEDAIAAGDNAMKAKDYSGAQASYKKALEIKPNDGAATAKLAEVDKQIKANEALLAKEKEYNDAMSAGNTAKDGQKYQEALAAYKKAESIKPGDGPAKTKIAEVEGLIKAEQDKQAKEKEYNDAMAAGNTAVTGKKYGEALASFQKAESIKKGDAAAKAKIAEVEALIKAENDALAKEKEYTEAMTAGNAAKDGKKYQDALASYKKAEGLKPGDAPAKAKIAEVEKLIKEEEARLAADKEFADLLKKGDQARDGKKYNDALSAYKQAEKLKANDPLPKERIREVEKLIEIEKNAALKEQQYADAMKAGDAALTAKKYDEAKKQFTLASTLKSEEPLPKQKLAEIDKILADQKADEEKNKAYADAIKKADQAFTAKSWSEATAGYKEALGIKPGEKHPTDRLKEIEKQIALENEKKDKEERYKQLIATADAAYDKQDWSSAKTAYTEALTIKVNESHPKTRLADIAAKEKALLADAEKQKQYDDAMKQGDDAVTAKKYPDALAAYKKAEGIKPNEALPKEKQKEVQKLIDAEKQAQIDAKYAELIRQANGQYDAKELSAARALYVEASRLKEQEQHPKTRITDIDKQLGDIKDKEAREQQYADAMKAGDAALTAKKYDEAKKQFTLASNIKSEEPLPKQKLAEIDKILADQKADEEKNKAYADAIKKADQAFTAKSWPEATAGYKEALGIKPGEKHPTDRLKEIEKQIALENEKKDKEERYKQLIATADAAYDKQDWSSAKTAYTEALTIKANESHPKTRLADIAAKEKALLADAEKQKQYDDAMKQGDDAVASKKYPDALAAYKKAEGIKPNEALPKEKQKEVQKLIDAEKDQVLMAKYNEVIKKADDAFTAKDYSAAKAAYKEALALRAGETHPAKRLADIEALEKAEKDRKLLEQQYSAAMTKAAGLLAAKKLNEAKAAYQAASDLKPEEQEPKDRIAEINQKLDEIAAAKKAEEDYKAAMAKGQKLFSSKDWIKARMAYREALSFKPDDAAAKAKIEECNKELAKNPPRDLEKEYQAARNRGDDAFKRGDYKGSVIAYKDALSYKPNDNYSSEKIAYIEELQKYSEGTTVKTKKVGGCNIEERVVVKDNQIFVYTKKIWDWGGVFWFKNDVSITEAIFEAETNSTNQ